MITKEEILAEMALNFKKVAEASDAPKTEENLRWIKSSRPHIVTSYYFQGGEAILIEKQDSFTKKLQTHSIIIHQNVNPDIGKGYTETISGSNNYPFYFEKKLEIVKADPMIEKFPMDKKDFKKRAVTISEKDKMPVLVGSVNYFAMILENLKDIAPSNPFDARKAYVGRRTKIDEQEKLLKVIYI